MKFRFVILFSIYFALPVQLYSQKIPGNSYDSIGDRIELILPPLSVLIDSASKRDPSVKAREDQIKIDQYKLRTDRSQWSKSLGVQGDVRYGTYDNYVTNQAGGQPINTVTSSSTDARYGVGAYVKLSIFDIFNIYIHI